MTRYSLQSNGLLPDGTKPLPEAIDSDFNQWGSVILTED